ncbi:hypothetical protein [Acinetobacter courvalinii]|uniref:hypothetical protein n=1 Tax=Acinetobacter courvalinii TaxID=280147 RepID=UPI002899CEFA|nr:hypothetical protein [Acinetobacter courvalinii]
MNNYKIKVNDAAESKEAQELFIQLGVTTHFMDKEEFPYWLANDGVRLDSFFIEFSDMSEREELTLPQLRDLVAQSKSKVREYLDPNDNYKLCLINPSDAAQWMIEVPEGAELLTASGKEVIFWKDDGQYSFHPINSTEWDKAGEGLCDLQGYMDDSVQIVWKREAIQPEPEQGLISGAEALAKVHTCTVQYSCNKDPVADRWTTITDHFWDQYNLGMFLNNDTTWRFRLKPRTIKLEIEIPAPFEPRERERYWFIDSCSECGYSSAIYHDVLEDAQLMQYGAYQSEQDVIAARDALRGLKG